MPKCCCWRSPKREASTPPSNFESARRARGLDEYYPDGAEFGLAVELRPDIGRAFRRAASSRPEKSDNNPFFSILRSHYFIYLGSIEDLVSIICSNFWGNDQKSDFFGRKKCGVAKAIFAMIADMARGKASRN